MTFSFQLYSARNYTPWDPIFATVAKYGYRQVEGYAALYEDPAGMRSTMDKHGLSMPSSHFALDLLENDLDSAISIAKTLGCERLYCPFLAKDDRPDNGPGWQAVAQRLEAIGKRLTDAGFRFGWHNHEFEFVQCKDGTVPMAAILDGAPSIEWEADIAWIRRGGADPIEWISRYGARISAAHVKDIAENGQCLDEDGWADVGHGTMNWQALMTALIAKGNTDLFVIEHDNPNDYERFARRSITTLQQFQEG